MLKQIRAVTIMNLASIPSRLTTSLVVVIGMTCVVAVFVSMLSLSVGFMQLVHNTGRADRAIVLSKGSLFEGQSTLPRDALVTLGDAPGIARTPDGTPLVSGEAIGFLPVIKKSTNSYVFATLRGIGPEAFFLRPNMKLTEGRMFKPAVHEVIVGQSAQAQFKGLQVGDKVSLPEGEWTVVGSFVSGDDEHQSEILADTETVLSAYRRANFNSATVQLTSVQAFDQFKDSLTTNPTLNVDVQRESEYYEDRSKQLINILSLVAYWVGGIMAMGAVFGALNTMYAAVSSRTVEIATLRAIGFSALPVVISVIAEALLLAASGAVIGGALAWFAFNGNQHGFGGTVFKLMITPMMLIASIAASGLIGLIGGLFPAIRAARLPVTIALQAR